MISSQVSKLTIQGYADAAFSTPADEPYTAQVNPESYTYKYALELNTDQAQGTSATDVKFSKTLPEEIGFQFVFDSSGVIKEPGIGGITVTNPLATTNDVVDALEAFKKVVLSYDGSIHQPRYLKIHWGTLLFKGKLKSMDIEFKLFKPDGTPIRAFAKATFIGSVEDDLRAAQEDAQSPDITHLVTVVAGDTLPNLAYKVYGNSSYYMEVAKFNNLNKFRNLSPGTQLIFPPLT